MRHSVSSREPLLEPPALKPGDLIAVVCPAGPPDAEKLKGGVNFLESLGYRVRLDWSPERAKGFLADDDEARAAELNRALQDPEVRAIACACGGYGASRILPLIDYAAMRADPKPFLGYSDITALHIGFYMQSRVMTFHSPIVCELADPHPATAASFKAALEGRDSLSTPGFEPPAPVVKGQAEGVLVGGNLSLMAALQGTPWMLDTTDAIVLLEDVHEESYRLDGMMWQLRLGGFFEGSKGIVVGRLHDCDESYGTSAACVMRAHLKHYNCPAVDNFSGSHSSPKLTLPLGSRVMLDADKGILRRLDC